MVRRAVLGTPQNSIPTAHLLFSSLQRSAASGSQKDGAANMAVNQSAKSSPEHSAHARARVRDIAQKSIARSEGSAVATFNQWRISAVVMSTGIGRSCGRQYFVWTSHFEFPSVLWYQWVGVVRATSYLHFNPA